jgi:hypothetical protein
VPLSTFTQISLLYLVRSAARMVSLLLLLLIIGFIAVEGFPKPSELTGSERLLGIAFIVMTAGLAVGWFRELAGGILILGGFLSFMAIEYAASGDMGMGAMFVLFPVAGVLYLVFWWFTRMRPAPPIDTRSAPPAS